ncbi:MAG: 1-phosphofructokinase family hexose kinase [Clostridiales bacterium]|nr:1-phosphofructokinase family hexose kinase [Clostridiales bacterium]
MIVTVTANPALDKTVEIKELLPGELNRVQSVFVDAAGKGVNVSKTIAALGGKSTATGFIGGAGGDVIEKALEKAGIDFSFIHVAGETRTNLKVIDRGSRMTEINEPGILATSEEARQLEEKLEKLSKPGVTVVIAGSLCRGVEPDYYARLVRAVHSGGGRAFLDADGEAFKLALKEKPDFIKPNTFEIMQYFGASGDLSLIELKRLCMRLVSQGVSRFALSMGKEGAMFINGNEALFAPGLKVDAHSSAGAGDSMTAAIAHADDSGLSWREACILAMATSAGSVTTKGTKPPSRELVESLKAQVKLEEV